MTFHTTTHSRSAPPPRGIWLFWLAFTLLWFSSLGHNALIHPDEGRYASISLGMLQSGDWITPRLNGLLYFEKPALPYWMCALSFKLFGFNEFAARLWPALCGLLSVACVGFSARRLWGSEAAHLSAMVMGSCCWIFGNSHFLNLDSSLTLFMTLTLCAFLLAQREDARPKARRNWMWTCWAAMALATLSKGLIGFVIPGSVLVLYSLLTLQFAYWRRLHLLSGLVIFLLLGAPWFLVVSIKNPGFAQFFFIHEHFERFLTTGHKRTGPFWYFVPVLLLGFMPWTSMLPGIFRTGLERTPGAAIQPSRLLLIWSVFIFLFFSKSDSKLPSYILPIFPALALLAGHYLSRARARALCKHLILPSLVWLALLALYPFRAHLVNAVTPPGVIQHFATFIAVAAVVSLIAAAIAWRLLRLENVLAGVAILALGSLLSFFLVVRGYDAYGELKSTRALVSALELTPDTEVYSVRYYDQTLPFYLQRPVTLVEYVDEFSYGEQHEPSRWIHTLDDFIPRWKAAPHAVAFIGQEDFETLQKRGVPMQVIYRDPRHLVVGKP